MNMPSDEDQIAALLKGEDYDLVRTVLGKEHIEAGDYARVITVSFDAVVGYLNANCTINDIAITKESPREGYYALPNGDYWVVYRQERGVDSGRDVKRSENDVFAHFAQTILGIDSNVPAK
jgi:hypothetical protein